MSGGIPERKKESESESMLKAYIDKTFRGEK